QDSGDNGKPHSPDKEAPRPAAIRELGCVKKRGRKRFSYVNKGHFLRHCTQKNCARLKPLRTEKSKKPIRRSYSNGKIGKASLAHQSGGNELDHKTNSQKGPGGKEIHSKK